MFKSSKAGSSVFESTHTQRNFYETQCDLNFARIQCTIRVMRPDFKGGWRNRKGTGTYAIVKPEYLQFTFMSPNHSALIKELLKHKISFPGSHLSP